MNTTLMHHQIEINIIIGIYYYVSTVVEFTGATIRTSQEVDWSPVCMIFFISLEAGELYFFSL